MTHHIITNPNIAFSSTVVLPSGSANDPALFTAALEQQNANMQQTSEEQSIDEVKKENEKLRKRISEILAENERKFSQYDKQILDLKAHVYHFSKFERILEFMEGKLNEKGFKL